MTGRAHSNVSASLGPARNRPKHLRVQTLPPHAAAYAAAASARASAESHSSGSSGRSEAAAQLVVHVRCPSGEVRGVTLDADATVCDARRAIADAAGLRADSAVVVVEATGETLLACGDDSGGGGGDGDTPIADTALFPDCVVAAVCGRARAQHALRARGELLSPRLMSEAARAGRLDTLRLMVAAAGGLPGADRCSSHGGSDPPLLAAVGAGRLETVGYLLSVDPSAVRTAVTALGESAVVVATRSLADPRPMLARLLEHGADPLACDSLGASPLQHVLSRLEGSGGGGGAAASFVREGAALGTIELLLLGRDAAAGSSGHAVVPSAAFVPLCAATPELLPWLQRAVKRAARRAAAARSGGGGGSSSAPAAAAAAAAPLGPTASPRSSPTCGGALLPFAAARRRGAGAIPLHRRWQMGGCAQQQPPPASPPSSAAPAEHAFATRFCQPFMALLRRGAEAALDGCCEGSRRGGPAPGSRKGVAAAAHAGEAAAVYLHVLLAVLGGAARGAAASARNSFGEPALCVACRRGHGATAAMLAGPCGADVNEADVEGLTPLMHAAGLPDDNVALTLVRGGGGSGGGVEGGGRGVVDAAAVDTYGTSAAVHAERHGHTKLAGVLRALAARGVGGGSRLRVSESAGEDEGEDEEDSS